jgi:hypothetical protein
MAANAKGPESLFRELLTEPRRKFRAQRLFRTRNASLPR